MHKENNDFLKLFVGYFMYAFFALFTSFYWWLFGSAVVPALLNMPHLESIGFWGMFGAMFFLYMFITGIAALCAYGAKYGQKIFYITFYKDGDEVEV